MSSASTITLIVIASVFLFTAIGILAWRARRYVQLSPTMNHLESIPLTDFTTYESDLTTHPHDPFASFTPIRLPEPVYTHMLSHRDHISALLFPGALKSAQSF
jgi:hypothetical protein